METNIETYDTGLILQWHPAACSAVQLEMGEGLRNLACEPEHNLSRMPLRIDLLVVKDKDDAEIRNEIGKLFSRYNVMEFKSPDASCSSDVYYKTVGYACLYKADRVTEKEIPIEDITISIIRKRKPVKLLKYLRKMEFEVKEAYPGIYYVKKKGLFDTQLIVTNELDPQKHPWITSLTKGLGMDAIRRLLKKIDSLDSHEMKKYADSVLNFVMEANPEEFRELKKEGRNMCEALLRLMKPELDEAKEKAEAEGRAAGMSAGLAEGRAEGRTTGIRMTQFVIKKLVDSGRFEELKMAAEDEMLLRKLAEEFGFSE
ncbi:MAG: hypothetical protein IJ468_08105 [Lachnospiraceae bacterium]|nr:hypothetical protein [Lachnospiraceae bacterium]